MSRYQEFQKKQVQCLLELREAQADTEAERRLEHLQQVRVGGRGQSLCWDRSVSPGSPVGHLCL